MPFASGLLLVRRESFTVFHLLSIHKKRQGMTDLASKDTKDTFRFRPTITYTDGERRSSRLPVVIVTHTQKTTKWRGQRTVTQAGGNHCWQADSRLQQAVSYSATLFWRGKPHASSEPKRQWQPLRGHGNKKWPSQSNSHPLVFQENHKVFCWVRLPVIQTFACEAYLYMSKGARVPTRSHSPICPPIPDLSYIQLRVLGSLGHPITMLYVIAPKGA